MEEGLFLKYKKTIQNKIDEREGVCKEILEKTGIDIDVKNISISKKEIIINTTSVIRNKLIQKNIKSTIFKNGYTVKI